MVLPIVTRAATTKIQTKGTPAFKSHYDYQTHAVQKAPYNLVIPYERRIGTLDWNPISGDYLGTPTAADFLPGLLYDTNRMNRTIARAYDKLKGKTYTQASLGLNLVEGHQSLSMIEKRAAQLGKFSMLLVRRRFKDAAAFLGMALVPPKVSAKNSFASNFLEYHFGWEPLLKDIHDALEVWNQPIRVFQVLRASAGERTTERYDADYGAATKRRGTCTVSYFVQEGARVKAISGDTLHSLDEWGVLNPASLLWEAIPFSFVVDWFVNVGQVLASFSDYAGMSLDSTFTSRKYTTAMFATTFTVPGFPTNGYKPMTERGTGAWTIRSASLSSPVFSVKQLRLPSKTRATTAVSLLTQLLSSRGK